MLALGKGGSVALHFANVDGKKTSVDPPVDCTCLQMDEHFETFFDRQTFVFVRRITLC